MYNGYKTRNLVATKPFPYMGKSLKVGDSFEATEADAKYLIKNKKATSLEEDEVQATIVTYSLPENTEIVVQEEVVPAEALQEAQQVHEQSLGPTEEVKEEEHTEAAEPKVEDPVKEPEPPVPSDNNPSDEAGVTSETSAEVLVETSGETAKVDETPEPAVTTSSRRPRLRHRASAPQQSAEGE